MQRESIDAVVLQGSNAERLLDAVAEYGGPIVVRHVTRESVEEFADVVRRRPDLTPLVTGERALNIANSNFIAAETRRLLGVEPTMIYPPITTRPARRPTGSIAGLC